jgi:la-related protein 1
LHPLILATAAFSHLQDFEELVLKDYQRYNSLYGLEKFWAFHHYSGLPADNSVEVCPQLKALLEGPFRNLDCFREEQQRRRAALEVCYLLVM